MLTPTSTVDPRLAVLREAGGVWLVEPLRVLVPRPVEFHAYASLVREPEVIAEHRFALSCRGFARTPAGYLYAALLMFSIDARVGRAILRECAADDEYVLVCLGDGRSVSGMRMSDAVAAILADRRFRPLRVAASFDEAP